MTKKDYIKFAEVFGSYVSWVKNEKTTMSYLTLLILVITGIVKVLKEDNPNFNERKFWDACGLPEVMV